MNTLPIGLISYLVAYTASKCGTDPNYDPDKDTKLAGRIDEVLDKLTNVGNFNFAYYQITKSANFASMAKQKEFTGAKGLAVCALDEFFNGQISGKIPKSKCIFTIADQDSATVGHVNYEKAVEDEVIRNFKPPIFFKVIKTVMNKFFDASATQGKKILTLENISYWKKALELKKTFPKFMEAVNYPFNQFTDARFDDYYKPKRENYAVFFDVLGPPSDQKKPMTCGTPAKITPEDFTNEIKNFHAIAEGQPVTVEPTEITASEDATITTPEEPVPELLSVSSNLDRVLSLRNQRVVLKEELKI
jgi:hypothetical protein